MKVLYIAEIVGKAGVHSVKKSIDTLKQNYVPDFIIANADGTTGGGGLGRTHAAYIHKLGVNIITLGECCFYKNDLVDNLEKISFVLRPANLSEAAPGIGYKIFKTEDKKIGVINLLGQNTFNRIHANNPFTALSPILEEIKKTTPFIIVDFHAQATAEKKTLFYGADGNCSAIIGSHTRVQTADEQILPNGTAAITDAGRTGSFFSVGGADPKSRIKEYITGIPDWTKEAWENCEIQGVSIELDDNGKATKIERIKLNVL